MHVEDESEFSVMSRKLGGHSIITFSQNDQNLDPPSLVRTCSILVTLPPSPANVQNFTPSPLLPPPPLRNS